MTEKKNIEEIFSKSIRAGRRTYFFDVRSTKAGDYYMTLTESKRDFNEDGTPFYKKHKIYLYKEDFSNFQSALKEVSEFIINEKGEEIISDKKYQEKNKEDQNKESENDSSTKSTEKKKSNDDSLSNFTEVDFDELG